MKNRKIHIYFVLCLALAACKKTENGVVPLPSSNKNAKLTSIPFASCKPNIIPKSRLYENCRDEKERQIDQKHYQMMEELLPYANEKAFKQLLSKSKNRENKTIYLREINQTITAVKSGLKTETSFPEDCSTEYEGYHYKDVVFVPNADWANFELSPIYSPGMELYDDISDQDEEEGNHDVIFGWYVDENGDTIEINIGEADCAQTTRPIIVAGLETCEDYSQERSYLFCESKKSLQNRSNYIAPLTCGLQINHRYDNTKYSEVHCTIMNLQMSGNTPVRAQKIVFKLRDINKNNVGSYVNFGFNKSFILGNSQISVNNSSSERIIYNLYEHDWYGGSRFMGKGTVINNGKSFELETGLSKFQHEWYAFEPGNLDSKAMPIANLSDVAIQVNFDQNKGKISLLK